MAKKYYYQTIEEFIHDQEFVETVRNLTNEKEWQKLLANNSESKEKILQARKFILLFSVREDLLSADKKQELWTYVHHWSQENKKKSRIIRLRKTVGIAASILVVLSLGSILFRNLNSHEMRYSFSEVRTIPSDNNAVLTLSNGDKIEVQQDKSQITILEGENAVQINNDTIKSVVETDVHEEKKIAMNELVVPYGKNTMVVLSDGTKVWLNAGSKFAFPQKFYGKKRKVFLDGEGYFEVAKNKKQPFIVSSRNLNVEVLGTKFNFNSYSSDGLCETVLLEGSVEVWSDNKLINEKIRMSPKQKVSYSVADDHMELMAEPEAENYVAWIEGWYKFANENLEYVLTKIGRFYNVNFTYDEDKIKNALPISGKLDLQESFEDVILTLSKVAEIEYKIEGMTVYIN